MGEIAAVFLRLGILGFGGPIAVLAMMEEEVCQKRKWMSSARFTEAYAICKVLPGPLSTQVAIYVCAQRAGVLGGILGGMLFILPSFLLVLVLSYFYMNTQSVQNYGSVFTAMQAGALVVILLSTVYLAKPYRTKSYAWAVALISGALILYAPRWEPLVILGFGLIGATLAGGFSGGRPASRAGKKSVLAVAGPLSALASQAGWNFSTGTLAQLFWVCFKAGAFVFGTGLAIVPMLEGDVVGHHHWLTHSEFMDGLAVGQVTPGPVVITATFIGYRVMGILGAVIATVGIFGPCFFNILYVLPKVWGKLSGTKGANGFAAWAIPAVIGGILGTTTRLGYLTLTTPLMVAIFIGAFLIALKFKPPAWLLIPLAGVAGLAGHFYH